MNTKFKRFICFLLILSLMFTLTGCGELASGLAQIGQTLITAGGCLIIAGFAQVLNEITEPFLETTGWCVCQMTVDLAKGWKNLMDPNDILGSWDYMDENQVSFHDAHLEILEKREEEKMESVIGGMDRFLGDGNGDDNEKRSFWDKLFGCDHDKFTYDPKEISVSCKCGKITKDNLPFEEFEKYVPKKRLLFWSNQDQYLYTVQEYYRYYSLYEGIDPEIIAFIQSLNTPSLTEEEKNQLSEIADFFADAAELVSTGGEIDDGFAKGMGIHTEFFSNVDKYFGHANTFFVVLKSGADMHSVEQNMQTPGKEEEVIHSTIEVMKDATSFIPIANVAFEKVLDTVETGIHTIQGNLRIKLVSDVANRHANDPNFYMIKGSENLGGVNFNSTYNWENGPSLKDLANANLTAELLYGLAPYIEFRVYYEIESIYGITLEEMIDLYHDSK